MTTPDRWTSWRGCWSLHKLYLFPTDPADLLPLDADTVREIQTILSRTGDYRAEAHGTYDPATRLALTTFMHRENLEERCREDDQIDGVVLRFMRALKT